MAEKIDYTKLINELFNPDDGSLKQFKPYMDVMKTFVITPGISQIFETSMKEYAVNDGKLNLKKFYKRIRLLLIEMGEFYEWGDNLIVPNKNIWNENDPKTCLPTVVGIFSDTNTPIKPGSHEYFKIHDICHAVGTNLQKITIEDFGYLNKLHKKYKKGQ
jgi:hypothetical protein